MPLEAGRKKCSDTQVGKFSVGSFDDSNTSSPSSVSSVPSSAAVLCPVSNHLASKPRVVQASPHFSSPHASHRVSRTSDHSSSPFSSPSGLTPYSHGSPSSGPKSLPVCFASPGKEPGPLMRLFSRAGTSPPMHQRQKPIHTVFSPSGHVNINNSPTLYGQSLPARYAGRRYGQTSSPKRTERLQRVSIQDQVCQRDCASPISYQPIHRSNTDPCFPHLRATYGASPPMLPLDTGFASPQHVCRHRSVPGSVSPSPSRAMLVGTSPPIMEGPVEFQAPSLSEETIMDVSVYL